jgi:hypothetical protein
MKRVLIFVLLFLSANVYADKWDDFLKDSGFPKKVIEVNIGKGLLINIIIKL